MRVAQKGYGVDNVECGVAQVGCGVAQLWCGVAQVGCSVAQIRCCVAQIVVHRSPVRQARVRILPLSERDEEICSGPQRM